MKDESPIAAELTKLFDTKNKSKAIKDMVHTANDLKNVGTSAECVDVNNNWDGNLYTYSFGRSGK